MPIPRFFELKPMSGAGIEGAVRLAAARAAIAERVGGLEEASEQGLAVLPLLAKVRDPALTTTFLNMLGRLLIGRARYDEAATQFQVGRDVANSLGFRFVLPHVLVGLAYAELGRRRFSLASRLLIGITPFPLTPDRWPRWPPVGVAVRRGSG